MQRPKAKPRTNDLDLRRTAAMITAPGKSRATGKGRATYAMARHNRGPGTTPARAISTS